jgi:hypothetical protein
MLVILASHTICCTLLRSPLPVQWPSDEAVSSLWDLHRIPREKVIEWFQTRRRQDQRRRGSGGSAAAGGVARPSSPGPAARNAAPSGGAATDWDAEWSKSE